MKKITNKIMFLLVMSVYFVVVSSVSSAYAADKTMSITLRIEGIEKNQFYATEDVPYTGSLTVAQALTYIDSKEDSIKITGADTAYITDINGETAGKFGGWDGWLYKVNGTDSAVGIDSMELSDGDSILLYYGDPYGAGMQFPVADTSDLKNGVIKFTSEDTTYDKDGNATVKTNPVVGATVTWMDGDSKTEYVTDKKGVVTIASDLLNEGAHAVQITKTGDAKLPLVLRFAPDYTITVGKADGTDSSAQTSDSQKAETHEDNTASGSADADNSILVIADTTASNTETAAKTGSSAPKTGENNTTEVIFLASAAIAFCGVIYFRRKEKYEK